MPFYQFDSSAIVKRYVPEVGTEWVRTVIAPSAGNMISIAEVTRAEVASALTRRAREGSITADESLVLIRALERHCAAEYRVLPTEHDLVGLAVELIQRHPLRAYDAIQLATAIRLMESLNAYGLPSPVLVSADNRLLSAAQTEGVTVENPNDHP